MKNHVMERVITILQNTLSPKSEDRAKAENDVPALILEDPSAFIYYFGKIATSQTTQKEYKNVCIIILRNNLNPKNKNFNINLDQMWINVDLNTKKEFIKNLEEFGISSDNSNTIRNNLTITLGFVMRLEYLYGNPNGFFTRMRHLVKDERYAIGVLRSVSATVSMITDHGYLKSDEEDSNNIFEICRTHINSEKKELVYESIEAFDCCIEGFAKIFQNQSKMEEFLHILFKFQSESDLKMIRYALEALNSFVYVFGKVIYKFIPHITEFFIKIVTEKKSVLNKISTKFEGDGKDEGNDIDEENDTDDENDLLFQLTDHIDLLIESEYLEIIETYMESLLTILFSSLKNEPVIDNHYSPHKAAVACLCSLNLVFGAKIINNQITQNFISGKIFSTICQENNSPVLIRQRAIGALALASVCDGSCESYLKTAVSNLKYDINTDEGGNESLYLFAVVAEKNIKILNPFLENLILEVSKIIVNKPEYVENAIWFYYFTFESLLKTGDIEAGNIVGNSYNIIIKSLFTLLDNIKLTDSSLRNAILTTVTKAVRIINSEVINQQIVSYLYSNILKSLRILMDKTHVDRIYYESILGDYIAVLSEVLNSVKTFIMGNFIDMCHACLTVNQCVVQGEIYLAVCKLYQKLDKSFKESMFNRALEDIERSDKFTVESTIIFLSECIMDPKFDIDEKLYAVINGLIGAISSPAMSLNIKGEVLETIGSIALKLDIKFTGYFAMCADLAVHVGNLDRKNDPYNADMLTSKLFKMLSCAIVSLGACEDVSKHINTLVNCIKKCISTYQHNCDKECLDFINDLFVIFQPKEFINLEFKTYFDEIISDRNEESKLAQDLKNKIFK